MTQTIAPWSPYVEIEPIVSGGRRTLVSAFSDLVWVKNQFLPHELPDIFDSPEDEGENDACRHLVLLDAAFLTSQLILGKIASFARPLGGGEVVPIESAKWEVDNPLPRMATGTINLDHWADPQAPATHRIFVDAADFDDWLAGLAPPGILSDAEIDAVVDPRLRAARTLALRRTKPVRKSKAPAEETERPNASPSESSIPASGGLITIKEIRALTKLGRSTLYRMMDDGSFPAPTKIGRSVRWPRAVIDEWIASQGKSIGSDSP